MGQCLFAFLLLPYKNIVVFHFLHCHDPLVRVGRPSLLFQHVHCREDYLTASISDCALSKVRQFYVGNRILNTLGWLDLTNPKINFDQESRRKSNHDC